MLTDLDIVNNALGRLGCERITSLEDQTKRANLANDFLNTSKRITLEMAPWDFALKRATLVSTGTPPFEFTHSFNVPSDYIKIVSEYNKELYFVEGDKILANAETLLIKYIYEIDETVKRSPSFDKAWYLNLAADMAYSLTQNTKLKTDLLAEAEFLTGRAASLNASGSSPMDYEFDSFLDPRF